MVIELKYSGTNTYLVRGTDGSILFDTGWAGSFPQFCRTLGEAGATVQEIRYLFISHFHPDHMGIAQEIADCGVKIVTVDVQRAHIHDADRVFAKEGNCLYRPIVDEDVCVISCGESRLLLKECGIVLSCKLDAPAPCRLDAPDFDVARWGSADCLHQHQQVI